jgi:hypothetical protein
MDVVGKEYPNVLINWLDGAELLLTIPKEQGLWGGCPIRTSFTLLFLVGLSLLGEEKILQRCLDGIKALGAETDSIKVYTESIAGHIDG